MFFVLIYFNFWLNDLPFISFTNINVLALTIYKLIEDKKSPSKTPIVSPVLSLKPSSTAITSMQSPLPSYLSTTSQEFNSKVILKKSSIKTKPEDFKNIKGIIYNFLFPIWNDQTIRLIYLLNMDERAQNMIELKSNSCLLDMMFTFLS